MSRALVPRAETEIRDRIQDVRGQRVLLDADLADLYRVPTRRVNEAVRRNPTRFPDDFMFTLTRQELGDLIVRMEPGPSDNARKEIGFRPRH